MSTHNTFLWRNKKNYPLIITLISTLFYYSVHFNIDILQCPFGRIVYKFDYKNVQFLNQVQTLITKINARALELDDMPQHVIDAALSTYKLSA